MTSARPRNEQEFDQNLDHRHSSITSSTGSSLRIRFSVLTGLLGCGAAFLALHLFSSPRMGLLTIRMPIRVLVETLVVAAIIGVLSAWFPARAASKMNIVEALRLVT